MIKRKTVLAILLVVLFGQVRNVGAGPDTTTKIDPLIRTMQSAPEFAVSTMKAFGVKAIGGEANANVIIKFASATPEADERDIIESAGGTTQTVIGNIVTAIVPIAAITMLEGSEEVEYIEAAKPIKTKMNQARQVTGVQSVQTGTGTTGSTAYNGNGTLVGLVDSGIDCTNADFFDASGNPRIVFYWDQTATGSGANGVTEIPGSTGREYLYTNGDFAVGGACRLSPDDPNGIGHGTHVAGIAASSNATYTGVAPQSNIISVQYYVTDAGSSSTGPTTLSTSVLNAVSYIFQKAQKLHKPVVVNLSLGTSLGAHDDTSLLEQGLDNLLINNGSVEKVGRAIVNASGNEDLPTTDSLFSVMGGIHAPISVSGTNIGYRMTVNGANASAEILGNSPGAALIDVWMAANGSCNIIVNAYDKSSDTIKVDMSNSAVSPGNTATKTDNIVSIDVDYTDSVNSQNGKRHALVSLSKASASVSSTILNNYNFDLIFVGTCTGDAWLYPDFTSLHDFRKDVAGSTKLVGTLTYTYAAGDSLKTMTIPGTASGVVTVGSFMDHLTGTWVDINGNTWSELTPDSTLQTVGGTLNAISLFSSLGPIAGATPAYVKPDLVAPGEPILSTLASNFAGSVSSVLKGDANHWKLQGSSMSAPHVAGTIALMFEKNACLKPSVIKSTLQTDAAVDPAIMGGVPNTIYGYGKLDALRTINSVTAAVCTPSNSADRGGQGASCTTDDDCNNLTCTGGLCGGGGGGSGKSCSLNKRGSFELVGMMFVLAGLAIIVARKRARVKQSARI